MNKRYRLCDVEEAVSEMEELMDIADDIAEIDDCLLYTSPSPRDLSTSRMPSSA